MKENLIGKSLDIYDDADRCSMVVVQRYGGAIFVIQTVLWFSMGVMYGVYLVKVRCKMSISWSSIKSLTKDKNFSSRLQANIRVLKKSSNICTIDDHGRT